MVTGVKSLAIYSVRRGCGFRILFRDEEETNNNRIKTWLIFHIVEYKVYFSLDKCVMLKVYFVNFFY